MHRLMKVLAGIGAGVTAALLLPTLLSASPPQAPPVVAPPAELSGNPLGAPFYESADGRLRMRAIFDPANAQVTIKSSYRSPTDYHKHWATIKTAFWPTCVREIENGKLFVAGKGRRYGNTIIEVWTFTPPEIPTIVSPSQGVVPGFVSDVNPVYSGDVQGKRLVREATPLWGGGLRALVQFHDSRDVYVLDVVSGSMTMLASPDVVQAAASQAIAAPLLAQTNRGFAGELVSGGFVYQFSLGGAAATAQSRFILRDSNEDGTIDGHEVLTTNQWTALGYGIAANWVQ